MDYKEYSRQRDIAVKRLKRLQAKGYDLNVHIPTVKELRASNVKGEPERNFQALSSYLETGVSLKKIKESQRIHYTQEQISQRKRDYQRDYRRRKVAKKLERANYPKKYQGYLKGLKTLGVDIKPSQLSSFFKYMDYRFAQGNASKKYVFDIFVDDYIQLLSKGYKPDQILADYEQFQADQSALQDRADQMSGYSVEDAIASWDKFIND